MNPPIQIQLFGHFQINMDGKIVTGLTSEKIQALVAYLAVEHNTLHSREFLAEFLWPERPDGVARQNLRQAISRLQRVLPAGSEPLLQIDRKAIRFQLNRHIHVDVLQFITLLEAMRSHKHEGAIACVDCRQTLAAAVDLYRGDFLIGCQIDSPLFEEWRFFKQEWLRNELLQALDLLVQYDEERQQWGDAYRYAQRSVEIDPLREVAHQQVMRSLAHLGRYHAALEQYATLAQLLQEELGLTPSAMTAALNDTIREQQLILPTTKPTAIAPITQQTANTQTPPHNLPVQHTPFVGRETELTQIAERIAQPECHLLTLLGLGGAGKTRLALEVATRQLRRVPQQYPDGIFFVPLDTVDDEEQLLSAVAAAVAFRLPDETQRNEERNAALIAHLQAKRLLLILDNYEHLVDHSAFVLAIIAGVPTVQLLVTSRIPLHLRAEWLLDVVGLPYPHAEYFAAEHAVAESHIERILATFASVQFFYRAAQRVLADFALSAEIVVAVGRLCWLTEGLPLALELAAGQIRHVSLPVLVETVQHNLDILATTMRDVPSRHRSLRAVFEHSWALLPSSLQALFCQLAVFRGPFTAEAALAVTGCSQESLTQHVSYSLVRRDMSESDTARYALHEVLRQYAVEQLRSDPAEEERMRARHGSYYLTLVAAQQSIITGVDAPHAIAILKSNIANIRASWQWAVDTKLHEVLQRAIAPLLRFFVITGQSEEGGHWADYALRHVDQWLADLSILSVNERHDVQHLCAELYAMRSRFFNKQARYHASIEHAEQALTLASAGESAYIAAVALMYWGNSLFYMGHFDEAEAKFRKALLWAEDDTDEKLKGDLLRMLGILAGQRNDLTNARQYYQSALAISQKIGDFRGMSASLGNLGLICRQLGDFPAARQLLEESLSLHRQIGDRSGEGRALTMLGDLSLALEEYGAAEEYCHDAIQLLRMLSEEKYIADALLILGTLHLQQNRAALARNCWQEAALIYEEAQEQPLLTEVRQHLNGLKDLSKNSENKFDSKSTL